MLSGEMQPALGLGDYFESVTQGSRARSGARQPWAEFFNPVGIVLLRFLRIFAAEGIKPDRLRANFGIGD